MEPNKNKRKPYPSDVTDAEWAFVVPYLALMKEDAPQRDHSLREVFNGLRWMVRGGTTWRMIPHGLPPWYTIYQQAMRWIRAGVFEAIVHDLREILRLAEGRKKEPSRAIIDSQTIQSHLRVEQEVTGESALIAFVDQGYTGD